MNMPGLRQVDGELALRLLASAATTEGCCVSREQFDQWLADRRAAQRMTVRRIPFAELSGWRFDAATGDLGHHTGRFFTIQGLSVRTDRPPVPAWTQPIINQTEIGVLGILIREFDGVLHCLMQAKVEPGNVNGIQLSPTVQATKSNYQQVHGGTAVPYIEFFRDAPAHTVVADVLQSEQGSWFYQKRNRNMVVEVGPEVVAQEDFIWLTLGQISDLLREPNLVNMDARTVLSCLPYRLLPGPAWTDGSLGAAIARSSDGTRGGLYTIREILSWITGAQAEYDGGRELISLGEVRDWQRFDDRISHETGAYFSVVAVDVTANAREVRSWSQPLIEPHGLGQVALLVCRIEGVLHALVHSRVEPGFLDVVELAPSVQCAPDSYNHLGDEARPMFLDVVLGSSPDQTHYDCVLSEEGGRFLNAVSRYRVIEVDAEIGEGAADYRWMTLYQLTNLLQFSHYLNVQLRTLVAVLRGLG
ncbi:NDP-hexose 2,3-dehydratase family protein [Nocardia terpenica]|uniref:NDP-hexose 2,3-dehydratase n=1 Tax=Nocardia terpenica TaxID=455432 RepID=A0A291RGA9_9NOCA|nr:NDP-hexose 2,3-dehydratase family protein [Nocardia terpenica]ATL66154.1 NDP-hexose 2,3-dehydratase [Nocardia terpenica]